MKKNVLTPFLLVAALAAAAQQPVVVSLGAGFTGSSSGLRTKASLGNGYNLHGDVFVPFLQTGNRFTLGVNAGIDYVSLKNLPPGQTAAGAKYQLFSGTTVVSSSETKKYTGSFSGLAGLQAEFAFGKLIISPVISAGYISFNQDGYTQTGSFAFNGQSFTKDLEKQDAAKESGILIKPRLKLSYAVSNRVQVYLSPAFTAGPQMEYTLQTLVPQGGLKENNTYEPDQIQKGSYTESRLKSRYTTSEINAGISIGLGGNANATARKKPRGKVTKPGDNGMLRASSTDSTKNPLYNPSGMEGTNPLAMAAPGSPIGGIVVKGGKNPGGNMISVTSNNNGEFELNGLEAGNYQFTLTAPGEPAAAARPGSPIGGIVVKGGKNPGGNMSNLMVDQNGNIRFEVLEAGNYKFKVQTPDSRQNKTKKEKVNEKPPSGLKDVLKTNV